MLRPTRRRFVANAAAVTACSALGGVAKPYLSRAADRPAISHGVQSGDVSTDSGVVWARADRPARMLVEWSTTESFNSVERAGYVDALPESDLTANMLLEHLPAGEHIFYRISFADLASPTIISEPMVGHFRTAPADRQSISFIWSGDTAGQGWGIDESRGGMRTYATMLRHRPDFFIHSGDNIYADVPMVAERKMPNGEVWHNLVTEEKSKPAETLADYRGNYKYNLLDKNVLAFNREIPIFSQWDDHDVLNNWWPGQPLTRPGQRRSYVAQNVNELASRAARAYHEYIPMHRFQAEHGRVYRSISYGPLLDVFLLDMRSYRGPNGEGREETYGPAAYLLAPTQLAWLKRALLSSRATWKVIAADQPIGLLVSDDFKRRWGVEAVADGDNGPPRGRELEMADLLASIKHAGIRNTVWLTADVHYTAAHYYDPNKAAIQDFEPFWEFVSGPIHAATGGPNPLDGTFGPQLMYVKAPTKEQGFGLPPSFGMQFFGHVAIEGATEVMTVTLRDVDDNSLWSTALEPKLG